MFEDATLADKVTLVTGAGSGIGRASALALRAGHGPKLWRVTWTGKSGLETVRLIRDAGGEALFVEADVSKSERRRRDGSPDPSPNTVGWTSPTTTPASNPPMRPSWTAARRIGTGVIDINLKGVWLEYEARNSGNARARGRLHRQYLFDRRTAGSEQYGCLRGEQTRRDRADKGGPRSNLSTPAFA